MVADGDFGSLRVAELKAMLKARGISLDGCFDKESLVQRAEAYRELLYRPPDPPLWAGGEPEEQGPSSGAAAALILLHGFGDSGGGFISSMGGPLIAMDGLRVVFPSAPRVAMGGFPVSSWLATSGGAQDPRAMLRADDAMAQAAVDYVHALVRREISRGVPAERIVVGGFSQGGLVAMRAALSFPDAPLGGCLALSTFFGADEAAVAPANAGLRVIVAHGAADGVVPPTEARRTEACLRRLAPLTAVDVRMYDGMGHASCDAEAADLRAFLRTVVESPPPHAPSAAAAAAATATATASSDGVAAPATPRAQAQGDDAARRPHEAELERMSAGELKALLRREGVPTADCFEKSDLLARARDVCAVEEARL